MPRLARVVIFVLPVLLLSSSTPALGDCTRPVSGVPSRPSACCKVCRKGKACGDSCIARDKVCRKGPGCACDG
jgi:hypothetical protein